MDSTQPHRKIPPWTTLILGLIGSAAPLTTVRLSLSGSTPPRLLIPTSQNGIIARQTDVFRVLREQSEGSRNVDGGNGNGESPGNSIVQGRVDDSLDMT